MCVFLRALLIPLGLALVHSPVLAFDDDFTINNIDLRKENFLDIKAQRNRKSLEYYWFDSISGWRINIASLNSDTAFVQTELKLQNALSEYVNIRLALEQEIFYADKDFPLPTVEAEIYPWAGNSWLGNLGFSLLGTPAFEKQEIDTGLALIWGKRPWNYIRFEYLEVDSLYNRKNFRDNTFYRKEPITLKFEAAYQFDEQYKLRFTFKHDTPLEFIDPDNEGVFKHKTSDYFLLFDYRPVSDSVIGITINGFTLDKSNIQLGQDQQQVTDFVSVDVYWVKGIGRSYELRLGTQYDYISNDIRDSITGSNELDYSMKTLQIYTTAYHPFNENMAWDLGLYVGQVEEKRNFLQDKNRDSLNDGTEAKLRMGFEYSSSDGRNSIQVNFSLNLDDLFSDPGDGGAISFQSVF